MTEKFRVQIEGMKCDGCAETLRKAFSGQAGIKLIEVRRAEGVADIEVTGPTASVANGQDLIEDAGFTVTSHTLLS